jgi:hypothetical protein
MAAYAGASDVSYLFEGFTFIKKGPEKQDLLNIKLLTDYKLFLAR